MTTKEQGDAAEDRALAHLVRHGLRLVARNYRTPGRGGGEFVKPAPCAGCVLESRCFGLRRGYAQMYGWDELRPVTVPSEPDRALDLSPAPP